MKARFAKHAALERLAPLIGEWEMEVTAGGKPLGRARTWFEWLEGDAFIIQRTEVEPSEAPQPPEREANSPFPITTIIGADDASDEFAMLYTDARGVCRVCRMTLTGGIWSIRRDAPGFSQRFSGSVGDGGRSMTGRWEKSRDGAEWTHDFDVRYRKVR